MKRLGVILLICFSVFSCKNEVNKTETKPAEKKLVAGNDSLIYPEEVHFKSIRQVTFGGDNAEAYWSFDDKQLVFQSNNAAWNVGCDQMFLMDAEQQFDSIPSVRISFWWIHWAIVDIIIKQRRCLSAIVCTFKSIVFASIAMLMLLG